MLGALDDRFSLVHEKVMFPFICFIKENLHKHAGWPRPSDIFMTVPKRHFHHLEVPDTKSRNRGRISMGHDGWERIERLEHGIVDVFIDTFHDSDSMKDWNPFYTIQNRERYQKWYSIGHVLDRATWDAKKIEGLDPDDPQLKQHEAVNGRFIDECSS